MQTKNNSLNEVDIVKRKIDKANTVNILDVFKTYHLYIDNANRKIVCPFTSHKGGQESSASFYYYPDTNSFFCFGCKAGGGSVDFVSKMENIHKYDAAIAILNGFNSFDTELKVTNLNQNKFHLDFSHTLREFILLHKGNVNALKHAEYVSAAFDDMIAKYQLEDQGLELLINKLKKALQKFQ